VQKLSAETYKEQMSNQGKTLTALGSYWKGRKPLILNKACILGRLLPIIDDPARDLEIFEKLMAMDDESFVVRTKRRAKPKEILATLSIARINDYFNEEPIGILPSSAPVDWSRPEYDQVEVSWRKDITELDRRQLEAQMLPRVPYRTRVDQARRPEEVMDIVHDHIWVPVNAHLGTTARSFPQLIEQLGIMRFGHRPRVADTFCGSGQIPFEAAKLGCRAIDQLAVETDGQGWQTKALLYCLETRCPQSGWMVPLLSSRVVSHSKRAIADLIPDAKNKRYEIIIRSGVAAEQLIKSAAQGTIIRDSRFGDAYLMHQVEG
jgi:putative DNA methylase